MESSYVLLLMGISLIFTLLMFLEKERIFAMLSTVLWFISGGSVIVTQNPYTYVVENNPGEYIEKTGVQDITANWPLWSFCIGMGLFCLFFLFMLSWEDIKEWLSRRGGSGYGGWGKSGGY